MSYHRGSDIYVPFGALQALEGADLAAAVSKRKPEEEEEESPSYSALARKPRLVAWIVSHCRTHSRRENYARELGRHVGVDVFGGCGRPFRCRRNIYGGRKKQCQKRMQCSHIQKRQSDAFMLFCEKMLESHLTELKSSEP